MCPLQCTRTIRLYFHPGRAYNRGVFQLGCFLVHMKVMVWYDNAMIRGSRFLTPLLFGGLLLCTFLLAGGVSHAQGGGGVGSGGTGGGGGGSDGHWTWYGWGWRLYPVTSGGPNDGFRSGSWSDAFNACNGYSNYVAVFVIDDLAGTQMGYNYDSDYYGPPTYQAYLSSSPYISVSTAQAQFNTLPASIRSGFTFGVNVSWYCYGIIPPNNKANLDGIKIDNAGSWASALNTVTVSVSGSGSDTNNPFYFSDASGGGNVIDMGTATSTTRTISISGVPPGWQLLGHSICANGSACTNAWLVSNIVSPGVLSFNHVFQTGITYHMRWMFQPITVDCTAETFPKQMVVGGNNTFTVSLGLSYWGSPFFVGNPALTVQVRNPAGVITTMTPSYTVTGPGPVTITSDPMPIGTPQPGIYQMQWSLIGNGLNALCPGGNNGSWSNPRILEAGYRPFYDVVGGDILSGGSIRSWNEDAGGFAGGGTQLAALATNDIQSFVSGTGLPGGVTAQGGDGLGFANTGASGTTYGGGYTVTPFVPVIPAQTNILSGPVNLGFLAADGVYYANNISLSGQLATGRQVTIYVTSGSVYISGNITYGAYGASPSSIPRLTVIVQNGNVSVSRAVTEMRGIYVAGGTGANGNFQSCTSAVNTPILYTTANAYTLCNSPLTVYGAVSANKLVLGRTYGTYQANVTGVPVTPAERVFYSPELWLAPDGSTSATQTQDRYDSFVSLPPVL